MINISKKLEGSIRNKRFDFPEEGTPEERLMLSVIIQAIKDSCAKARYRINKTGTRYDVNTTLRNTGRAYLRADMPHAKLLNIDPAWVREILNKAGIDIRG